MRDATISLGFAITGDLKRPTRRSNARAEHTGILGLAGGGVCLADSVAKIAVRSYRPASLTFANCAGFILLCRKATQDEHLFTLTPHLLHILLKAVSILKRIPSRCGAVYFLWHFPFI